MKIHINDRSSQELLSIMEAMNVRSPCHLVQVLITQAYKSIPPVEEVNRASQPARKTEGM